jgi:hypothetical protein
MADFATGWNGTAGIGLSANLGTQASPVWTALNNGGSGGANELRWSDSGVIANNSSSAVWPFTTRPGSPAALPYLYAYTADAVGSGVLPSAAPPNLPTAFARANYNQLRIGWDNAGTFASAPILTAYNSSAHANPTRGDGSVTGGANPDTGTTTPRSYVKANMFGANTAAVPSAPGAGPGADPAATDGATGALTFAGSAAWLTNFQSLGADLDYIQYGNTPTALTAAVLYIELAFFVGPNMLTATLTPDVPAVKYSYI